MAGWVRREAPGQRVWLIQNPDRVPGEDPNHTLEHWLASAGAPLVPPGLQRRRRRPLHASATIARSALDGTLPLHAVHPHVRGDDTEGKSSVPSYGSPPRAWGRRGYATDGSSNRDGSPPRAWGQLDAGDLKSTSAGSPPRAWGRRQRWPVAHVAAAVHPHVRGDDAHGIDDRSVRAVHPHVRGDDRFSEQRAGTVVRRFTPTCVGTTSPMSSRSVRIDGSPPRAWGRRTHGDRVAGRSVHPHVRGDDCAIAGACSWHVAVHPHVRGDDVDAGRRGRELHGSPPRAWGRRASDIAAARRAGSPPRAWGRRRSALSYATWLAGSPPRAWGRRSHHVELARREPRFTPTCVGTTCQRCAERRSSTGSPPRAWGRRHRRRLAAGADPVHPHVRGDIRRDLAQHVRLGIGSPPRAWGRRLPSASIRVASLRFTPTCVGTDDLAVAGRRSASRFTPTCVGTTIVTQHRAWLASSVHPHVRGDNCCAISAQVDDLMRFTPTCVGTTTARAPRVASIAVHPHVRGDDVRTVDRRRAIRRFTPTCVGTTSCDCSVPL